MATPTQSGLKFEIEVWYDPGSRTITFSSDDRDLGPMPMTGSFRPGSAAENRVRELLARYGKLPDTTVLQVHRLTVARQSRRESLTGGRANPEGGSHRLAADR